MACQWTRKYKLLAALHLLVEQPKTERTHLAAQQGSSARQLDRKLKKATGMTVAENHDHLRYEHARRALLEPEVRVKEVAAKLGFRELSSFSRWFQHRAGCSPKAYQARFRTEV